MLHASHQHTVIKSSLLVASSCSLNRILGAVPLNCLLPSREAPASIMMSSCSSCFGFRKSKRSDDREPLLPRYEDETVLQRRLHQKLHTYQMIRALSKGFMPSTEQAIINLRTLLASDILNPNNPDLSDSGRRLVRYCKEWLRQFIELLRHKNERDQIQDFIWYLTKSRVSLDTDDISHQASKVKARADATAGS